MICRIPLKDWHEMHNDRVLWQEYILETFIINYVFHFTLFDITYFTIWYHNNWTSYINIAWAGIGVFKTFHCDIFGYFYTFVYLSGSAFEILLKYIPEMYCTKLKNAHILLWSVQRMIKPGINVNQIYRYQNHETPWYYATYKHWSALV